MQFILEGGEIEKPIPESTDYPGSNNIPKYIYNCRSHRLSRFQLYFYYVHRG